MHSRYDRRLSDTATAGREVLIRLTVRRMFCDNPACARKTFAEQVPQLTAPHARYTGKRFDPASGSYDMGFRDYQPSINRFTVRDTYNGALNDMALGTNPWTGNRYAFTGGNPITGIEIDGHKVLFGECVCSATPQQVAQALQKVEAAGGNGEPPWAGSMDEVKRNVAERYNRPDFDRMVGAPHSVENPDGLPEHLIEPALEDYRTELCGLHPDHCFDISVSIAASAAWIASPQGLTEHKSESARKVTAAASHVLNTWTKDQILDQLSIAEKNAMLEDKSLVYRFYGHAIHRATNEVLQEMEPNRFRYNSSRGPDFWDTKNRVYVELTTKGQVTPHVLRGGRYPGAAYVAYNMGIMFGLR